MLNHKKVLSLALASAMSLSMMAPAFAAETTESTTNRSLKIDGTYQATTIDVVVPTSGTIIINPYALPVKISDVSGVSKVSQQIVTKPMAIKNKSNVKLDINVSATATVKGSLTLAAAPITDTAGDQKNEAFVYLAIEPTTLTADTGIDAAYATQTWTTYVAATDSTTTPDNVLALKTSAVTKNKMGTLAAATMDTDGETFASYSSGSIAFVGLSGQCAQAPKTAWTTKDGLTATIAFTFTPNTTTGTGDGGAGGDGGEVTD
jgi:hypothetical protein